MGKSMFDDDGFDERFNRHFDRVDKMLDSPGKTFFKFGLAAVLLNLLFWGAILGLGAWLVWLLFL